jgi:hypothetical protein
MQASSAQYFTPVQISPNSQTVKVLILGILDAFFMLWALSPIHNLYLDTTIALVQLPLPSVASTLSSR